MATNGVSRRRYVMDGAGHQFLARAAFAGDEDGRAAGSRYPPQQGEDVPTSRRSRLLETGDVTR